MRAAPHVTGLVNRSSSSTARSMSSGWSRSRASWSGVIEQGQGAATDQVRGRVVAGEEQQEDHGEHLLVAELVAFVIGPHERRDQAVVRIAAALVGQPLEQAQHALRRGEGNQELDRAGAGALGEPLGPSVEGIAILRADAEHVRDHSQRQRRGELVNQVDAPLSAEVIDEALDHSLDIGCHLLDHLGRERPADETAQSLVVRVVFEHHAVGQETQHAGEVLDHRTGAAVLHDVAREPLVGVHHHHVVVPGEQVSRAAAHELAGSHA
jgi:hypothetical protein